MLQQLSFTTGDQSAFNQVFEHFYDCLCRFANSILDDECSAQDVVGDVFSKLWERGGNFPSSYVLKTWLFITTRNACFNLRKKPKPQSDITDQCLDFPASANRELQIMKAEQIRAVIKAVETLPPRCKIIMHLSFFHEFSNAQIAALFGISVFTVKNQRARGVRLLRQRLQGII